MLCCFYDSFSWVLFLKFNGRIISSFVFAPFASSIKVFIFYQNVKTSYFKCQLYNIYCKSNFLLLVFLLFYNQKLMMFWFLIVKYLHLFWFTPLTKYLNYVTLFPCFFFLCCLNLILIHLKHSLVYDVRYGVYLSLFFKWLTIAAYTATVTLLQSIWNVNFFIH